VSVWAFIFDGVYIGLTATRRMLVATFAAAATFFAVSLASPAFTVDILWSAFLGYLLVRGVALALMAPNTLKSVDS